MGNGRDDLLAYVGTYTRGDSEGIYACRFDRSSGNLEVIGATSGVTNPSYLAIHPDQRRLYAVSEADGPSGAPAGAVAAFAIDGGSGNLTFLNQQLSRGAGPCHVSVDRTGRYVLVANYQSGSVAILPVLEDGSLGEATDAVQHVGSSVDPERQQGPHAHSINLAPDNRYAFAADLGLDKVLAYRLDLERGKLPPNEPPWAQVRAGAGPRHFAFHPGGGYAYLINELDSTLTAFAYDAPRGVLDEVQTVSTLPDDFSGRNHPADVHVSPSGRFVYGSNRGHDSIAIFEIDQGTGMVTAAGHESTRGMNPRNFAIDPSGRFLLAANQDTNNIVTFSIDPDSGALAPTGHVAEVPMPVCIKMMPFSG